MSCQNNTIFYGKEYPQKVYLNLYTASYTQQKLYNFLFDFVNPPVKYGYISELIETQVKSTNSSSIYEQINGLAIKFYITLGTSEYVVEEFPKQSTLSFFGQIGILCVGIVGLCGLSLIGIEYCNLQYKKNKRKKKKKNEQEQQQEQQELQEIEIPLDERHKSMEELISQLKQEISMLKDEHMKTEQNASSNTDELNQLKKDLLELKKNLVKIDVKQEIEMMKQELKVICELLLENEKDKKPAADD